MVSLSIKYRPQNFNDVVGQQSTIKILKKQLQVNKTKNAYLFCGASGSGKTTLARILAKELNGVEDSAIELDAARASSEGKDTINNIVDSAKERSITYTYKVFIIDECHLLSKAAWNALLKTLEEPPKYTVFILCTTEPNKVPDTIKNRCQRFNITKIPSVLINERLKYICCQEGFTNYEDTCDYISKNCKNQMRDAISILEQTADISTELSLSNAIEVTGASNYEAMFTLINAIIDRDVAIIATTLNDIFLNSINMKAMVESLLRLELDINKYIIFHNMSLISTPLYFEPKIKECINFDNPTQYHSYILNNLLDLNKLNELDENIITAYIFRMAGY